MISSKNIDIFSHTQPNTNTNTHTHTETHNLGLFEGEMKISTMVMFLFYSIKSHYFPVNPMKSSFEMTH